MTAVTTPVAGTSRGNTGPAGPAGKRDGGKADRAHRHSALTYIRQTGGGVPFAVAETVCTCARRSMEPAAFPPVGSRQGVARIRSMELASAETYAP
ncbi:hypothetical protein GCM10023086_40150 [Streptomyces venetus]|uniref:Uncharacterized protein n=1 Tax=Streptomyces venetus TaxID=1701086 RepID=A0ABP8G587_9ACTN